MSGVAEHGRPVALQAAVYGVAFFAGSPFIMISVIMPLWALELGSSPLVIGLIISSRQILVVTMAVHGGALLDRFGPRVVIVQLSVISAIVMALFPFFPFLAAIIVLQMVSGFAEATTWIGTQALVGRSLGGHPVYAGRMTASARVGGIMGPWLTGLTWQFLGSAAAFWFLALWIFMGGVMALLLPRAATSDPGPTEAKSEATKAKTGDAADTSSAPEGMPSRSVMPSLADYFTTYRLLLLPAVALVITVTFLRQTGSGIQSSFYGVWLKGIGIEAGTIGLLLGIANAASAVAALAVGPLSRRFSEHWVLIAATIAAIAAIAITPLLGGFALLALAISIRGIGQGLNFPLMLAIASRAVGPHLQGRVVALRLTFNRFGGAIVPFAMGALAEVVGLEFAFYVIGIGGVLLLWVLGIWASRSKVFRSSGAR
ncbi:MAG: MFS transporter [Alphaproteobacteria bacterium]|nr:MFS transporter [Alphaproteobacteria bacterium]